jgi:hypothetical protein
MFHAAKMMGLASKYLDKVGEAMNYLYDTKISDKDYESILKSVFLNKEEMKKLAEAGDVEISTRKANIISEVVKYYHESPTQEKIIGTAWGALNSITGYFQNVRDYSTDDAKMKNIVLGGTAYRYAQTAFNKLLKV